MIKNVLKPLKWKLFRKKWRKTNAHNFTSAGSFFKMENVSVGVGTYGPISIVAPNNDKLVIGNYVSIAENVHFVMGSHDYRRISTYPFQSKVYKIQTENSMKIVVEDDVWIGYGVTILTGVTIGKGAVIAANSVVTKDVPPYAVWIGNKVYKYRFSEEICKKLMDIDFSAIRHFKGDAYESLCQQHVTDENIDEIIKAFTKGRE